MRLAAALLVCAPLLLGSCAAILPGYGGRPPKAEGKEPPPKVPYQDLRGVIHCHSYLSHDSRGSEETIAQAANSVGLDYLIMTDHYDRLSDPAIEKAIRGFRGKTLFLPGAELRKDGGSLLVLGAESSFDPKQSSQEIAAEIHRQGGLVFIGHIEEYRGDPDSFPYDGLEIYNIHAAAKNTNPVGMIFRALFLPPKLVFESLGYLFPKNIELWEKCLAKRKVPICAGNDAHANVRIFGPLGGTIGTYEEIFRTATTHVWVHQNTREEILGALREGRSYISFDVLRDATGFWVEPVWKDKKPFWQIYAPESAKIKLFCKGKLVRERNAQWLEAPIEFPNEAYHVEVYLDDQIWILGGPFLYPNL